MRAPSDAALVRRYEPRDRADIRRICCETADRGGPVEHFFSDREVFADLLTRYYTDWEPGAIWVAEQEHQVVGYVTGCVDTERYRRVMAWRIIPQAGLRGAWRGAWCSCATWRLLKAAIRTWRIGRMGLADAPAAYPAHVHVNLRQAVRGRGIGRRLVERFIAQAAAQGASGLHAAVRGDNGPARHFFERLGFCLLSRRRVVFPDDGALSEHETLVYGKVL